MNKNKSFATLDDADLIEQIDESRAELFNLRFQFATGQLDDSSAIQKGTKKIARLLTELRSREIAAAEALERQEL